MYALGEVQCSWNLLLESLNIEEQESKYKATLEKRSKKKRVPKSFVTTKESSPVSRITRSRKSKLQSQQETENLQKDSPVKSLVPKYKPKYYKRIHVRRSTKKKIEQSKKCKMNL
jgi:hypothetical protein